MDIGKDLPPASARGESLGLLKFDPDGGRALLDTADHLVRDGVVDAWVIEATRVVCKQASVYGVNIAGEAWAEIDFPYDLDVARREVWPVIYRGRWRKMVHWRRTRRATLGLAASVLVLGGWVASTRVGPASIDWETVPAAGAEMVRIERRGEPQRWWDARTGVPVSAQVGGGPIVIEARLVMPQGGRTKSTYVVAVMVDGRVHDWLALTAEPDSLARLADAVVGDRDRVELSLPPGRHEVGISLIAGHAERLLVRIRQPEGREE
jgi:hypothetical protein